jgi:hypothetical protein
MHGSMSQRQPPEAATPEPSGRESDASRALHTAKTRGETVDQVLDRNVAELLQELRVAFTGVQILFGFLLSLAFTQRFGELNGFDLTIYTVALLCTALATMLLMAPVSFHRLVFRRRQKAALVVVADRLLIVGLALLVPAIGCAVLLIVDVVLGRWIGIVCGSLTALVGLLTWYALPLAIRHSGHGAADPEDDPLRMQQSDERPPAAMTRMGRHR